MIRTTTPDQRWMGERRHSTPNEQLPERNYVDFGDSDAAESAVKKWMPVYEDDVKSSSDGIPEQHSDPGIGQVSAFAMTASRGKRLLRERLKQKHKKEAEREALKAGKEETAAPTAEDGMTPTSSPIRLQSSERKLSNTPSPTAKDDSCSPTITPKAPLSIPRRRLSGRQVNPKLSLPRLLKNDLEAKSPTSVTTLPSPEKFEQLHIISPPPPPPSRTVSRSNPPRAPNQVENESHPASLLMAAKEKNILNPFSNGRPHNVQHSDSESDEEREKQENARLPQTEESAVSDLRQQYSLANMPIRTNRIKLHVYDLIAEETMMQLPWGCHFPIGQCFNALNSGLHELGTGAYHVGIEINGVEYAYGANDHYGMTGVFTCIPMTSPGYQYRTTIDLGERALIRKVLPSRRGDSPQPAERFVDGREVIREMAFEYMGMDYDLLRKNCVTFAHDACLRLGCQEGDVPDWFRNLCVAGAAAQDAANSTMGPISKVFAACDMEGFTDMVKKSEAVNDKSEEIVSTQCV